MTYDTAHAHSGKLAIRVHFRDEKNGYGGYQNLPKAIAPGETVWYRVYLYMPSTLSLSYGDVSGDGFGWNKFLVMAKLNHGAPRMYVQPSSSYKVDFGQSGFYGTGLYVNHDSLGSGYCKLEQSTYTFPRDKWFALQMAWHVATDSSAWVRVWSDDKFIGQCDGAGQVPTGYEVQSWGIGDYWNGGAWIKNGSYRRLLDRRRRRQRRNPEHHRQRRPPVHRPELFLRGGPAYRHRPVSGFFAKPAWQVQVPSDSHVPCRLEIAGLSLQD